MITSFADNEALLKLSANDVAEVLILAGVGCGVLFVRMKNDDEQILCRFTMSAMKAAGEFCKIVNFYMQTKQYVAPNEKEKLVCGKCGRPLVEGISVCLFCYNKVGF